MNRMKEGAPFIHLCFNMLYVSKNGIVVWNNLAFVLKSLGQNSGLGCHVTLRWWWHDAMVDWGKVVPSLGIKGVIPFSIHWHLFSRTKYLLLDLYSNLSINKGINERMTNNNAVCIWSINKDTNGLSLPLPYMHYAFIYRWLNVWPTIQAFLILTATNAVINKRDT